MAELVRTNNLGVIAVVEALLAGENLRYQVADRTMSTLEGSIGAIQMRVLVDDEDEQRARELLSSADLGSWLREPR